MAKIDKLRNILYKAIDVFGLNSHETTKASQKMNEEIYKIQTINSNEKYPQNNNMMLNYIRSYEAMKRLTKRNKKFPTETEWNIYAHKAGYLSTISMEYVSSKDWSGLRKDVLSELEEEKQELEKISDTVFE